MEYAQHIHLSTLIYTLTHTHTPTDMHRALEQRIPITRILSICLLSIIYLAEAIGIHVQLNATNDGIKWQFSLKISLKMVNRKKEKKFKQLAAMFSFSSKKAATVTANT